MGSNLQESTTSSAERTVFRFSLINLEKYIFLKEKKKGKRCTHKRSISWKLLLALTKSDATLKKNKIQTKKKDISTNHLNAEGPGTTRTPPNKNLNKQNKNIKGKYK